MAAASIMHESNSFNAEPTTLREFHFREAADWASGSTEVTGFLEESAGFEVLPVLHAAATPKGPVTGEAFDEITARLTRDLGSLLPLDGVFLALHGAMYSETYPHADEEIVRRVRSVIGHDMPLVVTHDFHANISPAIVQMTDALVTYQQCPHLDTKARGARAGRILGGMLRGDLKPCQALVKPPMLWNIVHQNTYAEPLRSITEASMELERQPGILAASVACGYQYNDVPFMGPSVIVVTDKDKARAQAEAQKLADRMWERRESTRLDLPDAAQAVAAAMRANRFPVSLFDVGDNIGGGSPGDETTLLSELLEQQASGWLVILYDPAAVAVAKSAGIDGLFQMAVGGKSPSSHGKPVRVQGKVRSLHHGKFIEPEVRHGGQRYWDMGHAAVIAEEHSTEESLNALILTSERCCPFSTEQLRCCGIAPERQKMLTVKGTVAPRAAYDPVSAQVVLVDTPGITSVNPARFQFKRVRSGMWGLEGI